MALIYSTGFFTSIDQSTDIHLKRIKCNILLYPKGILDNTILTVKKLVD